MAATPETEGAQHALRPQTAARQLATAMSAVSRATSEQTPPECHRPIAVSLCAGAAGCVTRRTARRFDFNLQSIANTRLRT